MLSDEARRQMKADAASAAIREDFERLAALSRPDPAQPIDLDRLLNFLTAMSRLSAQPLSPRPFVPYSHVLL